MGYFVLGMIFGLALGCKTEIEVSMNKYAWRQTEDEENEEEKTNDRKGT